MAPKHTPRRRCAIVHTPFTDADEIDAAALKRAVDWAFAVGADGLGTGMVSETLQAHERRAASHSRRCSSSSRPAAGRCSSAVGAESTKQSLAFAVAAEKAGCDAVMAVPPLTVELSEAHLVDHFRALADGDRHSGHRAGRLGLRRAVDPARRLREAARTLRPGEDSLQAGGRAERADALGTPRRDRRPGARSSKAPAASS